MKEFPMIRSAKAAAAGTLAVALPLMLLALSPLTGVYAIALQITLLPTALCLVAALCGMLPAALAALSGMAAMYLFAGISGFMLSAVYALPVLFAFMLLIHYRVPFWKACAGMILTHLLSASAVFLLLQRLIGGSLYPAAADAAVDALKSLEYGDALLYEFYRSGLLSLPESLRDQVLTETVQGAVLSAEAKKDLLLSVHSMAETLLKSLVPRVLVQQSILGGVGALLLPIRFAAIARQRRAPHTPLPEDEAEFPDLGMPPLSLWFIPRGMGWKAALALLAGGALQAMSGSAAGVTAGVILYAAASAVFTVQGAALLNFMQKSKGTRRTMRVVIPCLLLALGILPYLGIFDQIINIRGLRRPPETKEEE